MKMISRRSLGQALGLVAAFPALATLLPDVLF